MIEIVYNLEQKYASLEALGYGGASLKIWLTKADMLRLAETLTEIATDPDDASVARVWFDSPLSEGCVDYR